MRSREKGGSNVGHTHEPGEQAQLIELRDGRLRAVVNPQGAYLNSLTLTQDGAELPLLYPRTETPDGETVRVRGGSFVCLPLFGAGEGMSRHGFGQESQWSVYPHHDADWVGLQLKVDATSKAPGTEAYRGMLAILDYAIKDDESSGEPPSLTMDLTVANYGDWDMRFLPGFHPYLDVRSQGLSEADTVKVDLYPEFDVPRPRIKAFSYTGDELRQSARLKDFDGPRGLYAGGIMAALDSRGMPTTAIWSDDISQYICFEPTAAGELSENPGDDQLGILSPNNTAKYRAKLSWRV